MAGVKGRSGRKIHAGGARTHCHSVYLNDQDHDRMEQLIAMLAEERGRAVSSDAVAYLLTIAAPQLSKLLGPVVVSKKPKPQAKKEVAPVEKPVKAPPAKKAPKKSMKKTAAPARIY